VLVITCPVRCIHFVHYVHLVHYLRQSGKAG